MASKKPSARRLPAPPAKFVVGRSAFEKISAIEGIHPSAESLVRAEDFDRRGLSPEERRQEIIDAHRPKR